MTEFDHSMLGKSEHPRMGLSRVQLTCSVGSLPHEQRLASIRLCGAEVIPRVRGLMAGS